MPNGRPNAQPEEERLPEVQDRFAHEVVPPEQIAAEPESQNISPEIAKKCSQWVSQIALSIEDPSLGTAKEEMIRIAGKVKEDRRSNQAGENNEDTRLLPFRLRGQGVAIKAMRRRTLISFFRVLNSSDSGKQKTQAEQEEEKGGESCCNVCIWQ